MESFLHSPCLKLQLSRPHPSMKSETGDGALSLLPFPQITPVFNISMASYSFSEAGFLSHILHKASTLQTFPDPCDDFALRCQGNPYSSRLTPGNCSVLWVPGLDGELLKNRVLSGTSLHLPHQTQARDVSGNVHLWMNRRHRAGWRRC